MRERQHASPLALASHRRRIQLAEPRQAAWAPASSLAGETGVQRGVTRTASMRSTVSRTQRCTAASPPARERSGRRRRWRADGERRERRSASPRRGRRAHLVRGHLLGGQEETAPKVTPHDAGQASRCSRASNGSCSSASSRLAAPATPEEAGRGARRVPPPASPAPPVRATRATAPGLRPPATPPRAAGPRSRAGRAPVRRWRDHRRGRPPVAPFRPGPFCHAARQGPSR